MSTHCFPIDADELLKLDKEESELLNSIKLVDLDLKKVGRRLHEIRVEAGR
jgi:hypothetical protein